MVSLSPFLDYFLKKYISHVIFLLLGQISMSDCLYLFVMLGIMCIALVCFPSCDVMNFKIDLSSSLFQVRAKIFITFKGASLKQTEQIF